MSEPTEPKGLIATPLNGKWTSRCVTCRTEYAQGCGSSPCCGSVQEIVRADATCKCGRSFVAVLNETFNKLTTLCDACAVGNILSPPQNTEGEERETALTEKCTTIWAAIPDSFKTDEAQRATFFMAFRMGWNERALGEPEASPATTGKGPMELSEIGNRLRTQDNRCTANPMFCVQEKVTIYGMDPEWSDNELWIEIDDGVREVEAPTNGEETETIKRSAKIEYWKTVMAAFTEKGCEQYLALNGHNHRGETRIYVESWNRCPEMIAIRDWLLSAPPDGQTNRAVSR